MGKKVLFLPQCHSTNDELVQMARKSEEPEGMILYTDDQQKGKGQRGNAWIAEPGKNILMSLLLKPKFLSLSDQFYLNLVSGLAITDTLCGYPNKDLKLKWPNDVYLNGKKISGVLIEINTRGSLLESAVVGVGINVNQQGFLIKNATSLSIENKANYEREEIMENFLCEFEKWYLRLKSGNKDIILERYHEQLMWRGEQHIFRSAGEEFQGEIIGIDKLGRLAVNVAGRLKMFSIKEIEFVQ